MYRIVLLLTSIMSIIYGDEPAPAAVESTGQAAQQTDGSGGGGGGLPQILMIVLVVGFMWFILIRPQRKEEKRRKELMSSLKRGDKVVTIGGIHGEVATVGETTVEVRVGADGHDTVMKFNRGAIASVLGDTVAKAAT
jgi:preprotein translocase subunit YajC